MTPGIPYWKKAPFLRLLIPFITGILVQWYIQWPLHAWHLLFLCGLIVSACFFLMPLSDKYRFRFLSGMALFATFLALGGMRTWLQDVRNDTNWLGHRLTNGASYLAVLTETPVEKARSFKANATINFFSAGEKKIASNDNVILYFKKDTLMSQLKTGSRIVFKKPLEEIKNAGNPGGFDYKRYALFQGITHQVFLSTDEFHLLGEAANKWLPLFIEKIRKEVLGILRRFIPGGKEQGLAEALLIGYKNDLDKSLVQSYANTGVVHIIAISGLHLGLIYWLLVSVLKPLQKKKYGAWICPVIIIGGLWLFSLLAGAQPSILRSAVMFTCIVSGQNFGRKTSIYNTLALSAFILLYHNPFWLWDLGFQLSYSAVLSLVIFMQPVYNLLYIKNKLIDMLWKLNAVTIAAQILTIPLSIYYFHQLPMLFLFTNLVAVPLSGFILLAEIFLCAISFVPQIAIHAGQMIAWLINIMNTYIVQIDSIPFSIWEGLQINPAQVIVLFIFIAAITYWLLEKSKPSLLAGLFSLAVFFAIRCFSFWQACGQQRVIVYNIPRHQAIDLITGRHASFAGDRAVLADEFIKNFHVKPSRCLQRLAPADQGGLIQKPKFLSFNGRKIFLADSDVAFVPLIDRIRLDLLVISKNTTIHLPAFQQTFDLKQIVFDASVPIWKVDRLKKHCDSLHIPYYDVTEKGAFVMNLN